MRRAAEVALRDIGADAADPDRCGHAELPIAELLAAAQAVVGGKCSLMAVTCSGESRKNCSTSNPDSILGNCSAPTKRR